MKKPIHKLIGYTEEEYNDLVLKIMLEWADLYGQGSFSKMQTLIANRQINNWFHAEFKNLLKIFRADLAAAERHYKTNTKDRRHLFVVTATKMYDVYPKVLMTAEKVSEKQVSNNRLFSKKLGGGAILDLGCYPVSFSIFIASLISKGSFKKFQVLNKKKEIGTTDVDLDSYAEIKFDNNFRSQIGASFTKNLGKKTEIIGKEGKIIIEDTWHGLSSKIWVINKNSQKEIKFKAKENIYSYQIKSLSKNIIEHKKKPEFPGMTFEESLINMKIIQEWIN